MKFKDQIKKTELFQLLQKEILFQTMPKVCLISYDDKFVLDEFLTLICQNLLCPKSCGECETCVKIEKGTHLDFQIYPKKDKLKVEDS